MTEKDGRHVTRENFYKLFSLLVILIPVGLMLALFYSVGGWLAIVKVLVPSVVVGLGFYLFIQKFVKG